MNILEVLLQSTSLLTVSASPWRYFAGKIYKNFYNILRWEKNLSSTQNVIHFIKFLIVIILGC